MRGLPYLVVGLLLSGSSVTFADLLYTVTDLGPGTVGYAINDAGEVAGDFDTGSGAHAFLYANGQKNDLGTLGYGINNLGQVTGEANNPSGGAHARRRSSCRLCRYGAVSAACLSV